MLQLGDAGALTADFDMLSIQDLVSRAAESECTANARQLAHAHTQSGSDTSSPSTLPSPPARHSVILERSKHAQGEPPRNIGGISACAEGDLAKIVQLAGSGWDAACAVDKHGNTPLMWAAGAGHLEVVDWLVKEQGVDVQDANKQGRTALMWAAKNGQLQIVDWLLHQAPHPRADAAAQMKDGSRAFDWAIYGGHLPTLRLLASHGDVDMHALNHYGCGAAFWAAASGNVSALPPSLPTHLRALPYLGWRALCRKRASIFGGRGSDLGLARFWLGCRAWGSILNAVLFDTGYLLDNSQRLVPMHTCAGLTHMRAV
jgi:hypothetical protein